MTQIKNPLTVIPGGSANIINGVFEEYLASGEDINANNFVEFVNRLGQDTPVSTTDNTSTRISAVALDDKRVFLAHSYNSNYYLYGVVLTLDKSGIAVGTDTALVQATRAGYRISAVKLADGSIFIAHSYDSSNYLYALTCSVDGDTISVGTDTALVTTNNAATFLSAAAIGNSVFISHMLSNYLNGIVCTVSNGSITNGSDTEIDTGSTLTGNPETVLVGNTIFIAYGRSSSTYLFAIACTISGTTISKGSAVVLEQSASLAGSTISLASLDGSKVFVAHSYNTFRYLYGQVCSVSGTTITVGGDYQLSTTVYTGTGIAAVAIGSDKVSIFHSYTASYYLYNLVATISNTTITAGQNTPVLTEANSGTFISATQTDNGSVLVAHSSNSGNQLAAIAQGKLIQPTSTTINGLTKTKATETEAGKVWVLDTNYLYKDFKNRIKNGTIQIGETFTDGGYTWRVVHTMEDSSAYGGTGRGAILQTTNGIEAKQFNNSQSDITHANWSNTGSNIQSNGYLRYYLNNGFYDSLSESFKSIITTASVPVYDNGSSVLTHTSDNVFVASKYEMMGTLDGTYAEGEQWGYWKSLIPTWTDAAVADRKINDMSGTSQSVWLRSCQQGNMLVWFIGNSGALSSSTPTSSRYALPCVLIS